MRTFAIVQPFNLDWRRVAPRNFDSLELFVTPEVSIVFSNITNGKQPFKIGSFLMQDASKVEQFNFEILPQRSHERIRFAFKDEKVSAFFTLEDGKVLEEMFKIEGFICRTVEVHQHGAVINISELSEGIFHKIIKEFADLKVVSVMDFEKQWESFEEQIDNVREDVSRGIRKQQNDKKFKEMGITKKTLVKKSIVATFFLAASGMLAGVSHKMIGSKNVKMSIGGAFVGVLSIVCGMIGKSTVTTVVEHVQKGLILKYV